MVTVSAGHGEEVHDLRMLEFPASVFHFFDQELCAQVSMDGKDGRRSIHRELSGNPLEVCLTTFHE